MPIQSGNLLPEITQKAYDDNDDPLKANHKWWTLEDDEQIYASVFNVCNEVLTGLNIRRRMNYFFSTLYNDIGAAFTASQNVNLYYNRTALDGNAISNSRMTVNVLQNIIDAATAMIAKNKPKPQLVTDGAKDYATKVKGQKATKYIEGVFDEAKIYRTLQRVFQDACIYGTGFIKLIRDDDANKIRAEWVYIEQMLVDDLEGMEQLPRQMHQRKYIQRDVVIEQFAKNDPVLRQKILDCSQVAGGAASFSTADIIPVIESWHLRSGPKAKDGKHTICVETATLEVEEYKKDYFPIFPFRWNNQTLGYWGRGLCHELWKMQIELDTLYRLIQQSARLVGGPVLQVESGSNISEDHITSNRVAKIIEFSNTPAQYLTPPICQPEIYEHADRIEDRMYKISGVSQAQSTATKDPSLKSAVAQREAQDQAVSRLEIVGQEYENLVLDLTTAILDMSADLDNPSVMALDKGLSEKLNFKEVKLDMDDYTLQLFPISGLSSTPAGRLDQLMDYAEAGYLTKEQVMDVVDFPDLRDTTSLEMAPLRLTQQILSNIKLHGKEKYISPGPYLDLSIAYRTVCLEIDRSTLEGVDPANIDILRQWADEVKDLQNLAAQPQQPATQQQPLPQQDQSMPAQPAAQQPLPQQGQ